MPAVLQVAVDSNPLSALGNALQAKETLLSAKKKKINLVHTGHLTFKQNVNSLINANCPEGTNEHQIHKPT